MTLFRSLDNVIPFDVLPPECVFACASMWNVIDVWGRGGGGAGWNERIACGVESHIHIFFFQRVTSLVYREIMGSQIR